MQSIELLTFLKTEWFWAAASWVAMIGTFIYGYITQKRIETAGI